MFMMVSGNKTIRRRNQKTEIYKFSFETIIHYMPRDKSLLPKIATAKTKVCICYNNKLQNTKEIRRERKECGIIRLFFLS